MFEPIDIDLSDNMSIAINYSGGMSEYRYDVYDDGKIIGAFGMDTVIEDPIILEIAVEKYLDIDGRF